MNHLLNASTGVTSGVDMDQVIKVGKALLFSPLIGFAFAAIVFLLVKTIFKRQLELFHHLKVINHHQQSFVQF
jgi:PiT family inorganic phosphate transporter